MNATELTKPGATAKPVASTTVWAWAFLSFAEKTATALSPMMATSTTCGLRPVPS
ncbi:MAG: hypothetical protein U0Y68_25790 [Blastocatellia bacterium]